MEESRQCRKCNETRPITEFPFYSKKSPSRRHQCAKCLYAAHVARVGYDAIRAERAKYRASDVGKEAIDRGQRRWRVGDAGEAYRNRADVREKLRLKMAAYRRREPMKTAAREAVRSAKSRGLMVPACQLQCRCGKQAEQYHHHNGYEPEHYLDVIPLCLDCHFKADAAQSL